MWLLRETGAGTHTCMHDGTHTQNHKHPLTHTYMYTPHMCTYMHTLCVFFSGNFASFPTVRLTRLHSILAHVKGNAALAVFC